jgi:hypothetical protein
MINFQEVMQRVKQILLQHNAKKKILDRDIAATLKLDPQYYAVIKRRKKIPYEKLAYFCKENRISMNWILLEQRPKNLS